ncbi:MAG: efflux RND transporter permease subunit [Pseudomonadota bacterium]
MSNSGFSVARASIERPIMTWVLILICLFGGLWGFASLGRLEDPAFTIKQAVVITEYPGAPAAQVAIEVSEPLEAAIQRMAEVSRVASSNRPGLSRIDVHVEDKINGSDLPRVWTELRERIANVRADLPAGVGAPFVDDGFGDVFGIFFAVTSPGLTDAETHELATFLRRELLAIDGVADVDVAGLPSEAIFIEPHLSISSNLEVHAQTILRAISTADTITPSGSVDFADGLRTRIQSPDGSDTVTEIASLTIGVGGRTINLTDIARVSRGRIDNPDQMIRFNGQEAFTLGVAGLSDENIVEVGERVDARLGELLEDIPYGVELHPIYQQHVVVDESSNGFLVNLAMSLAIVVVVLGIFMGPRAAFVVGSTLLLTVFGTLLLMSVFGIEMERISLGALIIAMGMLVDNAIVVAEGMQVTMQRGKSSRQAAAETAGKTQIPLLGATAIGIMAFAGIGLSPDSTGEFLFSLFAVIAISLLLSWALALTVTPLLGHYVFRQGSENAGGAYGGLIFRGYAALLRSALRARWLVLVFLVAVTVACYAGFAEVKQQFFPSSNTPIFLTHLTLRQGTPISRTEQRNAMLEEFLMGRDDVVSVAGFIGQGASRFLLTYASEPPNPGYGHLIVRTPNLEVIPNLQAELEAFAAARIPEAEFRTERVVFGPGGGSPIAVRFSGSDRAVLRDLADVAMHVMQSASPNILSARIDWREQEMVLMPNYDTERAQVAGISREVVAQILRLTTEGEVTGTYREHERSIPIILRIDPSSDVGLLDQVVVAQDGETLLPLEQVVDGFSLEAQDTLIMRRDRLPTITVGASIPPDRTATEVLAEIRASVEAIALPPGYRMEWGGEYEEATQANESLGAQLPIAGLIMVLISVLLFNAVRQPFIIWLLVPMSVNGVVLALLGSGLPFTFTALLGLLSLSGMLIKNGIVLVEEIDLEKAEGGPLRAAIVSASTSRLRPVLLAASTTILGMIPLLSDAFFVSMAVTIMGGLAFASILTLIAAPLLYDLFFRGGRSVGLSKQLSPSDQPI